MDFFDVGISAKARRNVMECLDSGFISEGERVKEFEAALASLGLGNPVAVNSGTSALHIALQAAGAGPGDEVIIPAQTSVATGMAVLMAGAEPVFADIDPGTGNISPDSVRRMVTGRTRAVIPVHWAGYPCEMDELAEIASESGLFVLEDAAHALGAKYKGRPVGSLSRFTAFSFQAIKHCTTGDGGAVCCTDEADSDLVRELRWFGIDRRRSEPSVLGERQFDITRVGYKYHMNDFAASMGLGNLEELPRSLAWRRRIGASYMKGLSGVPGVTLLECRNPGEHAFWLFSMLVEDREGFIRMMKDEGIPVSVVHQGIQKYSVFGGCRGEFEGQRVFDERHIALPVHPSISDEDCGRIVDRIRHGW